MSIDGKSGISWDELPTDKGPFILAAIFIIVIILILLGLWPR